jgi:hypothetical protein
MVSENSCREEMRVPSQVDTAEGGRRFAGANFSQGIVSAYKVST